MTVKSTGPKYQGTFCAILALLAAFVLPAQSAAQDTESPGTKSEDASRRDPAPGGVNEAPVTGAARMNRLEQVIKLDQQKLAETKKELASQEAFFDSLNNTVAEREAELAEKRKKLEGMGGIEASDEARDLAADIKDLEQRIAVRKSELELRFNTAKTLKTQIQALEKKISGNQQAYEALQNPAAQGPDTPPSPSPAVPAAEQPAATTASPTQLIAPGVGTSVPAPVQQSTATAPETAEQIEARRVAEKLEAEAKSAEQELVSFVDRKAALDTQIELEQTLLDTAKESRQNIEAALDEYRADLRKLTGQGVGKAKLGEIERNIDKIQRLLAQNRTEIDRRRAYLDSLYKRRDELNLEQLTVTEQVEAKRKEAGQARKRSVWLESPLHPRNVWAWFLERGPRILMVIIAAWALLFLVQISSRRIARTLVANVGAPRQRGTNRADTLALSFQSALSLLILVSAILLAFQEAGVDIKTVLGGAAILGVAFAFGAQNLMRDYFTGFMIVLEDQYELGDLVTIGAVTGTVEKLTMRTTVLRDLEGRVHFIPNGEIKSVTNRTYVWGRAVLEIPVGLKEDADHVMKVIREVEEEFRSDPEFAGWVTGDPVMLGVDKFTEYGMIIKTFVQTQPDKIFAARRELLRRIKKRFDQQGIEISVPYLTLLQPKST